MQSNQTDIFRNCQFPDCYEKPMPTATISCLLLLWYRTAPILHSQSTKHRNRRLQRHKLTPPSEHKTGLAGAAHGHVHLSWNPLCDWYMNSNLREENWAHNRPCIWQWSKDWYDWQRNLKVKIDSIKCISNSDYLKGTGKSLFYF